MFKKKLLRKAALICFLFSNLLFIRIVLAQDFFPKDYPAQIRLGTRNAQDKEALWGYADIMLPVYSHEESIVYGDKEFLFFLNPKITGTDFSTDEENLGAGLRFLCADVLPEQGFILGVNVFSDTAYSKNGVRHNQFGTGLEFLSKWMDIRSNYYQPFNDEKIINSTYGFGQKSLEQYLKYEEPLPGFDAEIGILIPFICNFVETRIYGGGYWYSSGIGNNIEGTKARLEICPSAALTFNAEMKDDNVFGDDFYVGGHVSLRFDMDNLFNRRNPFEDWIQAFRLRQGPRQLKERMTEPVIRDINIVTVEKNETKKLQDVIFVDNSNVADTLEDGSLAHPHHSLQEAFTNSLYKEGVWIYVKKGDGTGTGYTGNYTLTDRVVLWGEGYQYLGLGGAGYPVIDGNNSGNVITLANDNTLMGLKIQNGSLGNAGIYGSNITNPNIHHNIITNNNGYGIHLNNTAGSTLNAMIEDNYINNSTSYGLWLKNGEWHGTTGNTAIVMIKGNQISNNIDCGVLLENKTQGTLEATLENNIIDNNSLYGIRSDTDFGAVTTITLKANTIIQTKDQAPYAATAVLLCNGADPISGAGTLKATLENNQIYGNDSYGLRLLSVDSDADSSLLCSRNIIKSNVEDGVNLNTAFNGRITADLGGGVLGAEGYNSIYGNSGYQVNNDGNGDFSPDATISALNNWWGSYPPSSSLFKQIIRSEFNPALSSNPNE